MGWDARSPSSSPPASLTKVEAQSSETTIVLSWPKQSAISTPNRYIVVMALEGSGDYKTVWDGTGLLQTLSWTVSGLTVGQQYSFKIMSVGFNGAGTESTTYSFYSWVTPFGFAAPTGVGSSTSITITWTESQNNGGWPITGYAIYRNERDGSSATTEVNSSNDVLIRNNPSLRTAVITYFPSSSVGKTFLFRIIVFTYDSSWNSPGLLIKLAGPPGKPLSPPTLIQDETNTSKISVQMAQVSDTGGDPIFTYNLQINDGKGGSFVSVAGESTRSLQSYYTITEGIVRGLHYRIRYRVGNCVGWSDFSDNLEAQAAIYPDAPHAPTLSA